MGGKRGEGVMAGHTWGRREREKFDLFNICLIIICKEYVRRFSKI